MQRFILILRNLIMVIFLRSLVLIKYYDDIRSRITSTLSDRAAVNKKVNAKLCEVLGRDLLDLSCNVHPLDS